MKALSRVLTWFTLFALGIPASVAQTPPAYINTPSTPYAVPLNQGACEPLPPPDTLKSPAAILAELRAANQIPPGLAPTVKVEKSPDLNAATNGREILITDSLLQKLDTNGERAFVIGHELAHVVQDHVSKTQTRRFGLSLLDQFLVRRYVSEGTLADLAAQLGLGLIDKKYSRNYEYQADEVGMKLMVSAGYPPCAALNVFDMLQANTRATRTPEFLMDHPMNKSRIQALVRQYQFNTGNPQPR